MASIALGIGSIAAGLTGSILGSHAATTAAGEQQQAAQQAIALQQQIFQQQQTNQAPFVQAGQQSIGQLMTAIQGGQFGPGSLPPVPNAPGAFAAPTLSEAQSSPGYQFTQGEGLKAIQQGAAQAGGNLSGTTLKALDQYNTGLADTTYQNVFNRALQGYNANLSQYASQLAGYQTSQGAQQQQFNQLLAPAQVGEGGVASINNTGTQASQSIGNLMTQIGNAQAAGTVGSANAITGGINTGINGLTQSLALSQLLKSLGGPGASSVPTPGVGTSTALGLSLPGVTPPFNPSSPNFLFNPSDTSSSDFAGIG